MADEKKPSVNTKPRLVAFIDHRINEDLATKAHVKAILEDSQEDTKRIEALRAKREAFEQEALSFGVVPANLAKALALSPKAKAVIDELEAQDDEMGRRYSRALRILEKRYPKPILAGLSFRWIEDTASPIGGRLEVGKALSGGSGGPRGFTADWQGRTVAYVLPKHNAMARLKVDEEGQGSVTVMVKGKAQAYSVKSPSAAAMLLHKACGLVHNTGKAWAPKTDVWLPFDADIVQEAYKAQVAQGEARAEKAKARADAKAKAKAIEAREAKAN